MLWLGTLTTDSYRSLLAMPSMRHVVASLFLARTAQATAEQAAAKEVAARETADREAERARIAAASEAAAREETRRLLYASEMNVALQA